MIFCQVTIKAHTNDPIQIGEAADQKHAKPQ